jgi:hypothetical protein
VIQRRADRSRPTAKSPSWPNRKEPFVTNAEHCQSLLQAAGWSTGERAITTVVGVQYVVDGVNGEKVIRAVAATSAGAWLQAARLTGMVHPPSLTHLGRPLK